MPRHVRLRLLRPADRDRARGLFPWPGLCLRPDPSGGAWPGAAVLPRGPKSFSAGITYHI